MQEDFIEALEPTPKLPTKPCRLVALLLELFLRHTTLLSTLGVWYFYDYFMAFFALILSFIVIGIIRSKLRESAISPYQKEHYFDDKEIALRYSANILCS